MKIYIFLIVSLITFSCSPKHEGIKVHHIGELREIMHKGQFQSRLSIDTLNTQHLFGLGAMDSLSGEILVLDDQIYSSKVVDSTVQVVHNGQTDATLFVYSEINEWDTLNVSDIDDVEWLLKEKSSALKLEMPFAFVLIGKPENLIYHIINFDAQKGDLKNHKEGALNGELTNEPVTILGFYATNAQGIYTHHDSHVHMHFLNIDHTYSGHVDDVDFANREFKLLIPKS